MTNSYDEIMNKISVTPEMHQRILNNLPPAVSRRKKILRLSRIARGCSVAACIALILTIVMMFSDITIKTPDQTNDPGEELTQAVNGIEECTSLDVLSAKVNFPVAELNGLPFSPQEVTYLSLWNNLAEIDYAGVENTITFRKSKENGDNSGDCNDYETTETLNINGISTTIKGNSQTFSLAIWQNGEYSYSISMTAGITREEMTSLLESNISN